MRLFLTLFLAIFSGLAVLTAGGVALTYHLMHWDASAWTQVKAWNSLPVLVGAVEAAVSVAAATGLTMMWTLLSKVVSAGANVGKPKKKPRAQSNRKTWS